MAILTTASVFTVFTVVSILTVQHIPLVSSLPITASANNSSSNTLSKLTSVSSSNSIISKNSADPVEISDVQKLDPARISPAKSGIPHSSGQTGTTDKPDQSAPPESNFPSADNKKVPYVIEKENNAQDPARSNTPTETLSDPPPSETPLKISESSVINSLETTEEPATISTPDVSSEPPTSNTAEVLLDPVSSQPDDNQATVNIPVVLSEIPSHELSEEEKAQAQDTFRTPDMAAHYVHMIPRQYVHHDHAPVSFVAPMPPAMPHYFGHFIPQAAYYNRRPQNGYYWQPRRTKLYEFDFIGAQGFFMPKFKNSAPAAAAVQSGIGGDKNRAGKEMAQVWRDQPSKWFWSDEVTSKPLQI